MSCTFVFIRSRNGIEDARRRMELAKAYVPVVVESEWIHEMVPNAICAAFSTVVESANGSYVHKTNAESFVVYSGWIAGRDFNDRSGISDAERISNHIRKKSFDDFVANTLGQWCVLSVDETRTISAAMDFLGGDHLYFGVKDGVVAISNRAIMCAVALHESIPTPDPWLIGWLLTHSQTIISENGTPFANVYTLNPGKMLTIGPDSDEPRIVPRAKAPAPDGGQMSWDQLADELAERARIIERLPNLQFRLTLTAGRDSRVTLGAILRAKCIDKLKGCVLYIDPDHPDAIIGKQLADHYGVPFETIPRPTTNFDIWEDLRNHAFLTEMGVQYWDSKGRLERHREGRLGGQYGEIYFTRCKLEKWLGWRAVANIFESDGFVDPIKLLTARARDHYRDNLRKFWQRQRDRGMHPMDVRDHWVREVRQWRWVGQGRQSDALGAANTQPIPSVKLLEKFQSLSFHNRRVGRVHFELMRQCDPFLLEPPFYLSGFSPLLTWRPTRVYRTPGSKPPVLSQQIVWKLRRKEIEAYLLAPARSEFFELVDRSRMETWLRAIPDDCPRVRLSLLYGVLGVRHSLEEPIRPVQCRVESV